MLTAASGGERGEEGIAIPNANNRMLPETRTLLQLDINPLLPLTQNRASCSSSWESIHDVDALSLLLGSASEEHANRGAVRTARGEPPDETLSSGATSRKTSADGSVDRLVM